MIVLALALTLPFQHQDTTTYRDAATAALIDQARQRHEYQDRLVRDYSATVRTRIDVAFGRSRFARLPTIAAHETAARITWALPNDLKVDILGERNASIFRNADMDAAFDRPWFIPRSLGDSIRLVDDELPSTAALHPLAPGADVHYRYAIVDSVTMQLPERTVRAVAVRVEPKTLGASLVAGDLWLDAETVEVVRFSFVFVGEYLWETPDEGTSKDSADARSGNVWANRIIKLEADLEYALLDAEYWMPFRQLVQLTVSVPWFVSATLPVRFLTTFDDYEVNQNVLPQFTAPPAPPPREGDPEVDPDTTGVVSVNVGDNPRRRRRSSFRCGDGERRCNRQETGYFRVGAAENAGRWEVYYPPAESTQTYVWPDQLKLDLSAEDEQRVRETIAALGELQEQLPDQWVGRMRRGPAFESFSDIYRFNRVQGSSVGGGYQWMPGPAFTSIMATGRLGLGDRRPTGSLAWRRDAPAGLFQITAFRAVRDVEPWTGGQGFGNSMNALFTGHDDADYYLALGAQVEYRSNASGWWRDASVRFAFEQQRSMRAFGKSDVADLFSSGRFMPNGVVAERDFFRVVFSRRSVWGRASFQQAIEGLTSTVPSLSAVRGWGAATLPFAVLDRGGTLGIRGGHSVGDDIPQFAFRAGGPKTVRGFPYGYRWGRSFWAAQLDVALRPSDAWTAVLFADAGDAYRSPPGQSSGAAFDDPTTGPMVGVGVGWSVLRGLVRMNLAKAIRPARGVRFDLLFSAPR